MEEPELHLHPALETSMMRYLKRNSDRCQVFLTTHSTNFIDTAEMQNVYLVAKSESTHVQVLDFEEAEAQLPKELGLKLSALFMYDRLVFVEGPTDESLLRAWSATCGINLSQANVGFVTMGGVRNMAYFAAETTMSFLSKRQVKLWVLIDRDEQDEEEVRQLIERLGALASIKVLNKRELENYLICMRPMLEFIKIKREMGGITGEGELPDEEELASAVFTAADQLKDYAVSKRVAHRLCRPAYVRYHLSEDPAPNVSESV